MSYNSSAVRFNPFARISAWFKRFTNIGNHIPSWADVIRLLNKRARVNKPAVIFLMLFSFGYQEKRPRFSKQGLQI